ncbi:MAG: hypothetical protein DRO67_00695 [Candidatus Asgardarchaeum californiense]|nr:MAG: hypothetical protein DRO67_00695 [Candidatus Asgardarchaeum californiense]
MTGIGDEVKISKEIYEDLKTVGVGYKSLSKKAFYLCVKKAKMIRFTLQWSTLNTSRNEYSTGEEFTEYIYTLGYGDSISLIDQANFYVKVL